MNFTLEGADPRFAPLRRLLEKDGHTVGCESPNLIAPPAEKRGVPYWTDEIYAIQNAALAAEGAVELLMRRTDRSLMGMEVLVVGYGRAGSMLAPKLAALGAVVTVAARNPAARARAEAQGFRSVNIIHIPVWFDAVVNTVPAPVLEGDYGGALCLDLASAPGGWPKGEPVLRAAGLPGIYAPMTAAEVLRDAVYRTVKERE